MSYLIMFCGIPGSGKSTEAIRLKRQMNERNISVGYISRDEIRFNMISEKDGYFSKEKEVFKKFANEMNKSLNENEITIIDATHLDEKSRGKILREVKSRNMVELWVLYLITPVEICLQRNATRVDRACVPDDVIHNMFEKFTNPTIEEFTNFRFKSVEVWEKPWKEKNDEL